MPGTQSKTSNSGIYPGNPLVQTALVRFLPRNLYSRDVRPSLSNLPMISPNRIIWMSKCWTVMASSTRREDGCAVLKRRTKRETR